MANKNSKNKNNKNSNNNKVNTNNKKVVTKNEEKEEIKKEVPKKEEVKKEVVKKETPKKEEVKNVNVKENKKKSFTLTSKQKDIVLILLVVILLVVALVVTSNKTPELNIELPTVVEGEAGFHEITYDEYATKLTEEKAFLVIIVKDGCGYCEMYEPIVEDVSNEYQVPIYYINLAHLTSEEAEALSKSNSYLKRNEWGTPTTLFMYGDAVVDSISGYVEKDEFVNFIKENIKVDVSSDEK